MKKKFKKKKKNKQTLGQQKRYSEQLSFGFRMSLMHLVQNVWPHLGTIRGKRSSLSK